MSLKADRQSAIQSILASQNVGSQEELIRVLGEWGYSATQATLSRDLRELNIVKVSQGGAYRYVSQPNARRSVTLSGQHTADGIVSVSHSANFLVVRTSPGFASLVASVIDLNIRSREIMGTIAGDDTILVMLRDGTTLERAMELLETEVPGIKDKLNI